MSVPISRISPVAVKCLKDRRYRENSSVGGLRCWFVLMGGSVAVAESLSREFLFMVELSVQRVATRPRVKRFPNWDNANAKPQHVIREPERLGRCGCAVNRALRPMETTSLHIIRAANQMLSQERGTTNPCLAWKLHIQIKLGSATSATKEGTINRRSRMPQVSTLCGKTHNTLRDLYLDR